MGSHSFLQIVGYRNLEELSTKLDTFSYRVTKEEALDLPDKVYTTREVSVTDEQRQHYMTLKKQAIAMFDNGDLVTAPAVITQLLRLQQVLCGHIKTDDGDLIEFPTKRLDALMETIEEMTGKVIIWSRFRYDIKKIEAEIQKVHGPGSVVTYFGDTTDEQRQQAIKDFQFGDAGSSWRTHRPQASG